jgi:hypothetical protein
LSITGGVLSASGGSLSATVTIPGIGDPYYDQVSLLLHGDGSLTDSSGTPKTVTAYGNAAATGAAKFGSASFSFDGNGDYLSVPYSSAFDLTTGSWTVEGWFRLAELKDFQDLFAINGSSNGYCQACVVCTATGSLFLLCAQNEIDWASVSAAATGSISANVWTHVAATRTGNTFKLYINGTSVLSYSYSGTLYNGSGVSYLGRPAGTSPESSRYYNGLIDEFRVTKGVARTITVPTAAYGKDLVLPVVFT